VKWFEIVRDRFQLRAFVNMLTNIQIMDQWKSSLWTKQHHLVNALLSYTSFVPVAANHIKS